MFGIGPAQLLMVGLVALLLFGSRLPQVARSLGKSLSEFKRGMQGVQDEFNDAIYTSKNTAQVDYYDSDDDRESAVPKFEPPTSPPTDE